MNAAVVLSSIKYSVGSESKPFMDKSPKKKVFLGMDGIDILLALVFVALIAAIGQLLLPPYGWAGGSVIGLLLLYLAKRKRDQNYTQNDQNPPEDTPR